jgi:hypothetical protein
MRVPQTKKRFLLRTPTATRARAHAVARWARALVPAATLDITPYEGQRPEEADDEDAIVLDMDDVAAGPLSLAIGDAHYLAGVGTALLDDLEGVPDA